MSLKTRRMNFQSSLEFIKIRVAKFDVEISQELRNLTEEIEGYDSIYNNRDLFVPKAADRFESAKQEFVNHLYVLREIFEAFHRMMETFDKISRKLSKPEPSYRMNELSVGMLQEILTKLPPRPELPKSSPPDALPSKTGVVKFDIQNGTAFNSKPDTGSTNRMVTRDAMRPILKASPVPVKPEIEMPPNNERKNNGQVAVPEPNQSSFVRTEPIRKPETPKPAPRRVNTVNEASPVRPRELLKTRPLSMIENSEFFNGRKLVFDSEQEKPTLERRNSHKYHQSLSPDLDSSDRWLDSLRKYKKPNRMLEHFKQFSHDLDENNNEIDSLSKSLDNIAIHHHPEIMFKDFSKIHEIVEYLGKQNLKDNKL